MPMFALACILGSCIKSTVGGCARKNFSPRFIEAPLILVDNDSCFLGKSFYSGTHSVRKPGRFNYSVDDPILQSNDFLSRWENDAMLALDRGINQQNECRDSDFKFALVSPVGIIADTGAAVHLQNWNDKVESVLKSSPTNFSTASGITTSSYRSAIPMPLIGPLETHLLPNSPTVFSVGKLNQENGVGFIWLAGTNPQFILKDGRRVDLEI